VELAGAGVLCPAPEPTLASKAGCVVLGVHGADTTVAEARQVLSGRDIQSLTHSGAAAWAQAFGASPGSAHAIGMTVDIAVPLAMAGWVGAVRIASIRAGRISLVQHEAQAGSRLGGHTILKHVGKTEAALRARLAAERDIRAASSFTTLGGCRTCHLARLEHPQAPHPDMGEECTRGQDLDHRLRCWSTPDTLIKGCLNQDYSYYADTLEGVIEAYKSDEGAEQVQGLRSDIARFLTAHSATLDVTFEAAYGFDCGPELWGPTAESFLKKLDRQLHDSPEP